MKSDENDLKAFLEFYHESQNRLKKKTAEYNKSLRKDTNPLVRTFKTDLADLNAGGKMLRGMLVGLGYRIAGHADTEESDGLALAFEIFQTGILVHDDVIDNAGTRRGKMTVQRRYGERLERRGIRMVSSSEKPEEIAKSTAICAGDIGIYCANKKIADDYGKNPDCAKLISSFDEIVINTIRGELLDIVLPYELQDQSLDKEKASLLLKKSVRDIYYLKTSCYSIIGPLHLGMLLGGAEEADMKTMDGFANELGIAYQIMDDILGIFADEEFLGKDVGSDISEFKQTILYMYVHENDENALKRLLEFYGKKKVTRGDLTEVRRIFRDSGALSYAQEVLASCFGRAERKLKRMSFVSEDDKAILRGFITYCKGRRK